MGPAQPRPRSSSGLAPSAPRKGLSRFASVRWQTDCESRGSQYRRMLQTPTQSSSPLTRVSLFTDATQLAQHLGHCKHACGPLHRARGAMELADAYLTSRFVSTLVVLATMLVAAVSVTRWLAP